MITMFKHEIVMNYHTDGSPRTLARNAGWSDLFYATELQRNGIEQLAIARARMLGNNAEVVGVRIQQVDPIGETYTAATPYPGSSDFSDAPQMSVLFQWRATDRRYKRPTYIKGCPDGIFEGGEFTYNAGYVGLLRDYITAVNSSGVGWAMRAADKDAPGDYVRSLDAAGVLVTIQSPAWNIGDELQWFRAKGVDGKPIKGSCRVVAKVDDDHYTINLTGRPIDGSSNSFLRRIDIVYPVLGGDIPTYQAVTHKVGRPTLGYRGRASTRR